MSLKNFSSFREDTRIYVRLKYDAMLEPVRYIRSNRCLNAQGRILCCQDPPDQMKGDSHTRNSKTVSPLVIE